MAQSAPFRWFRQIPSFQNQNPTRPSSLYIDRAEPTRCTIFEIKDEDEANTESNDLHYIMPLTNFDIPNTYSEPMAVMADNGLLLLYSELGPSQIPIIICNPITREYTELFCPEEYISIDFTTGFGFGASKLSGQYKVICGLHQRGRWIRLSSCIHHRNTNMEAHWSWCCFWFPIHVWWTHCL